MTPPGNRRVLLIDDTHSIHDDFRKILAQAPGAELADTETALFGRPVRPQNWAFELDSAYNGRDGVALAARALQEGRPYALAFVDMRMPPGWDGVVTIEHLWAVDPRVQVVICTAYSDHPWGQVLARLDVRDRLLVVKKPFDLVEVSQLARSLATKWELARRSEQQIEALSAALEALRESEAALRRSHGELEAFAHSLSHDLRAPLTAMSSFSQLLSGELEGKVDGKPLHYLQRIQANAQQGSELIDALLLLDKVSRAPCQPERLELAPLVRELVAQIRAGVPGRALELVTEDGLWCEADPTLLRIALRQLLDNAWKFTARTPGARIELARAPSDAGHPTFSVRDNGAGFDMAQAQGMFETPQRLHHTEDGTAPGVGLVVAHRAVARHGGRLWAESAPGQGAAFFFSLPAAGG